MAQKNLSEESKETIAENVRNVVIQVIPIVLTGIGTMLVEILNKKK